MSTVYFPRTVSRERSLTLPCRLFALSLVAITIMLGAGRWLVRRMYGLFGAALGLLGANLVTSAVGAGAFLRLPARTLVEQEAI